ncbi:MAG: hypothetical protein IV100_32905 [Myxococcales bacterium]|nr:hypothetical protein [Myxococcales bacterium]
MPKIVAAKHLQADVQAFQAHILTWIGRARGCAMQANINNFAHNGLGILFGGPPAGPSTQLVEEWFGALDGQQITLLRGNLTLMRNVLAHPQATVRIVDAPMIFGDRAYYAQVRGRYNPMMPRLSVEVADQWASCNTDTRVNTLFHELSHRILATVDLGPTQGYPEMMYGIGNAHHLADNAPQDALRNAENYGYFIALANGFVNQAP